MKKNIKRSFLKILICAVAGFLVPIALNHAATGPDLPQGTEFSADRIAVNFPENKQSAEFARDMWRAETVQSGGISSKPSNPLLGVWSNQELKLYIFDQGMMIFEQTGYGWEIEEGGLFSYSNDEIYFDGDILEYQLSGTNLTLQNGGERVVLKKETGLAPSPFEGVWREANEGYAFVFYHNLFVIFEPDMAEIEEADLFEYTDKTITFNYDPSEHFEYTFLPDNRLRINMWEEYELKKSGSEGDEASKLYGIWSNEAFKFYFLDRTLVIFEKYDGVWEGGAGGAFACDNNKIYCDGGILEYQLSGTNLTIKGDGERFILKKETGKKTSPFEGKWVDRNRGVIFVFYYDLCAVFDLDIEIDDAVLFEYTDKTITLDLGYEYEPAAYMFVSADRWRWELDGQPYELKKLHYGNF